MEKTYWFIIIYLIGSIYTAVKTIQSMVYKEDFFENGLKLSRTKKNLYISIMLAILFSWAGPLFVKIENLLKKIKISKSTFK